MKRYEEIYAQEREKAEQRLSELCMRTKEIRIILGMLLEESGFMASSIQDPESTHATAYREGQRSMGQRICELLMKSGDHRPFSCMKEAGAWGSQISRVAQMKFEKGEE